MDGELVINKILYVAKKITEKRLASSGLLEREELNLPTRRQTKKINKELKI